MKPVDRLSTTFLKTHAAAAAQVLEDHPAHDVAQLLATVRPSIAQQVIEHFTPGFAAACLNSLQPSAASAVFSRLPLELQVLVLRQIEHERRDYLLNALPVDLAASLRRRLPYPEGTAGMLMEASLASVPEELSVRHATQRVKRIRNGMKTYIYAVNDKGELRGVLTLHELISAPPGKTIAQVMHRHVASLSPFLPLQSLINSPYWQDYHALPITDENNLLIGAIRHKDLRRFQEKAAQVDSLSNALDSALAVGEMFSIAAGHLLASLIESGKSLSLRSPRV